MGYQNIGTAISEYAVIDVNANSSNEISLKTVIELNDGEVISSGDYICKKWFVFVPAHAK